MTKIPKLLEISEKFYDSIIIPAEVYNETIEAGLLSGSSFIKENALEIKKLVEEKFVEIRELKNEGIKVRNNISNDLSLGESSAIALAVQENIKNILIDEKRATIVAKELKLVSQPISALPILAYRKKWINKEEAVELLDELLVNNYYLSSVDYKKILSLVDK